MCSDWPHLALSVWEWGSENCRSLGDDVGNLLTYQQGYRCVFQSKDAEVSAIKAHKNVKMSNTNKYDVHLQTICILSHPINFIYGVVLKNTVNDLTSLLVWR